MPIDSQWLELLLAAPLAREFLNLHIRPPTTVPLHPQLPRPVVIGTQELETKLLLQENLHQVAHYPPRATTNPSQRRLKTRASRAERNAVKQKKRKRQQSSRPLRCLALQKTLRKMTKLSGVCVVLMTIQVHHHRRRKTANLASKRTTTMPRSQTQNLRTILRASSYNAMSAKSGNTEPVWASRTKLLHQRNISARFAGKIFTSSLQRRMGKSFTILLTFVFHVTARAGGAVRVLVARGCQIRCRSMKYQ